MRSRSAYSSSPTPVPQSIRVSRSTRKEVVWALRTPIPPLHPNTVNFIGRQHPGRCDPTRRGSGKDGTLAPSLEKAREVGHRVSGLAVSGCRLDQELHPDPGDLQHVVITQSLGL